MDLLKIFEDFKSHLEFNIYKDIQAFLDERQDIRNCSIEIDEEEKILITIALCDLKKKKGKELFSEFLNFIGYENYNLFIHETKDNAERYLYLTKGDTVQGVKMEMLIY